MIPDKPIDLGRLGAIGARRPKTPGLKEFDFQPEAHKDPERKWEFARDMLGLREGKGASDVDLLRSMKEQKDGPFSRRRVASNSNNAYTTKSAHRQASATSVGSGIGSSSGSGTFANRNPDEPRQTFANFAESGTHPPDWLERFEGDGKAAFDFRSKLSPAPGGFLGEQRRTPPRQQNESMPVDRKSPIPMNRPTDTGPSNKGFLWQVDDEFTAGDLQVSTSPPVSFGRTNTRINDIKKAEIEAEHDFPIKKSPYLERTNTKIDEIRRLEQQHGLADADDEPSEADGEDNSIVKRRSGLEALRRASPRSGPRSQGLSQQSTEYNGLGGERLQNTPVTIYKNGSNSNNDESDPQYEGRPGPSEKKPSPVSEDSQDLLRRLARASTKSPSPSSALEKVDRKPEEQEVEAAPVTNDKAIPDDKDIAVTSDDKDVRVNGENLSGNKAGLPFKRSVGFRGTSRPSSIHSVASKGSAASYDPTARLEAEAKLFALENFSERGSIRAPSPRPEPGPEIDNKDDDKTPQPNKFVDPVTMPTPKITGAYVDTPAPIKIEERVAEESDPVPSSKLLSPEKAISRNRDTSTSPRASRSEGQRGYERRRPSRDLRRTKSTPRRRSPLKNSVKPPTVQEDLRQICLKNEIDDSELDDLTDLIMSSADPAKFIKILKNDETQSEEDINEQLKRLNGMSESLRTGLAGIRTAKKGIERLEDQVSRPEKQADSATNTIPFQPAPSSVGTDAQRSDVYTYVHVPVPKLWRTEPRFKLTLVGWVLLFLSLWQLYWVVEDLFYDQWGKQTICYRGSSCRWNPDDPEYGFVIPVKVDEWVTGGAVRPHAAYWLEEAQDGWADFQDWLTGSDIRDVHHQSIRDSTKREQYWRRIEKKGLFPKWNPDPSVIPVIEAWEREAQAQEAAEARAALGYGRHDESDNDTGSMAEDQPVADHSAEDPTVSWW